MPKAILELEMPESLKKERERFIREISDDIAEMNEKILIIEVYEKVDGAIKRSTYIPTNNEDI